MKTLRLETDGRGVATLSLSRSEKHNAMSAEMIEDLQRAAESLAADLDVRVVVLAGDGPTFCAGGDLRWMEVMVKAAPAKRREGAIFLAKMLHTLNTLPKPVIGRCHGNAFGGGVGLLSVCDVAIGVGGKKLGLTETRLGLVPATIGPYVVARMGEAKARRVFMSSRIFSSEEAVELNLLARVVSEAQLNEAVEAEVAPYLECAPGAVANAKALARRLGPVIDDAVIEMSAQTLVDQWEAGEAVKGIEAFFAKEKAPWASMR
ncbi:methylglutaconyl-CoA hydratase [Cognatiyoonia sediminum]|uniref:Methylglutaconyl-CoA hydratase n=1 Tax=Cognatiyoonia sediminum TaxID=1508389 RepID=A0A1M5MTU9_9RHOB|nr:crotonase/enoyl-CoA hydratase family protein [Cognatiyoonia sediminum]SHG80718.1 methylglutaconyl-CoA hydratase [Cognatiyoonia sediminum]